MSARQVQLAGPRAPRQPQGHNKLIFHSSSGFIELLKDGLCPFGICMTKTFVFIYHTPTDKSKKRLSGTRLTYLSLPCRQTPAPSYTATRPALLSTPSIAPPPPSLGATELWTVLSLPILLSTPPKAAFAPQPRSLSSLPPAASAPSRRGIDLRRCTLRALAAYRRHTRAHCLPILRWHETVSFPTFSATAMIRLRRGLLSHSHIINQLQHC